MTADWREELETAIVTRIKALDTGGAWRSVTVLDSLAEVADVLGRALASVPFCLVKYDDSVALQSGGGAHEVMARFSVTVGATNFKSEDARRLRLYGLLEMVQGALVGWAAAAWTGEVKWLGEEAVAADASGVEIWVQEYGVRVLVDR